ncbi:hypothetical protein [Candidatus Viridilinea mediisalina]|uniref:Uncharacterized protein n=1 Tax=Candidatus Viridilinea mediisalina TaxID=2024553 RepID=A0A2A6RQ42_9CHLR|nr:hypothetical protein [Candidatus Viridilinea mediisalina]PDW05073.1 hypothetical protein CJ255_00330 [Candidatus Viridilinea mediisalina]
MKTVDLMRVVDAVEELLDLATDDGVLLRLPNGKVFLLRSVAEDDDEHDDFADEIARTRQNSMLMELLEVRSQEQARIPAEEARRRLGLDT